MALVAMYREEGGQGDFKRCDITTLSDPRVFKVGKEIVCQACGDPMYVRHSILQKPHFAHNPRSENRSCAYYAKGETDTHRAGKVSVVELLKRRPEYKNAVFHYEYYIKSVNRIADILCVRPDKTFEVHEIQLAPISSAELQERTDDYKKSGVQEVFWWLGREANIESNRRWCEEYLGYIATLHIETKVHTENLGEYVYS